MACISAVAHMELYGVAGFHKDLTICYNLYKSTFRQDNLDACCVYHCPHGSCDTIRKLFFLLILNFYGSDKCVGVCN